MRRYAGAVLCFSLLSGCMTVDTGPETGGMRPTYGRTSGPPSVPGVQGPYGAKVPMAAPYNTAPPQNVYTAQRMMSQNMPMNMVQVNNPAGMMPSGPGGSPLPAMPVPPGGILSPPGMPFAPGAPSGGNVNPTNFQSMMPNPGGAMPGNNGIVQAQLALNPAMAGLPINAQRTQVRFLRPTGMKISWFTQGPAGPQFSTTPIETPGRYNFVQGAKYRLKLANIEGRAGLEVYPTMEVVPGNPKTDAFLAHSSVPIEFSSEDFKQIADGNYVIKVIYLPDPQFQDVTGTGTDEIISTRLEPGQDPIQEALRRGSILLVIRMGNIDQEAPNTPALGAPGPGMVAPGPIGLQPLPGQGLPPVQAPFWGMQPKGQFAPPPPGSGIAMPPNFIAPAPTPIPPGLLPGGPNVPSVPLTPPGSESAPKTVPTFPNPLAPNDPVTPTSNKASALPIPAGPLAPAAPIVAEPRTAPGLPVLPMPPMNEKN